jgi:hypothetical protein
MGYEFTVMVECSWLMYVVANFLSVLADEMAIWSLCCQCADIDEKAIRREKPEELVKALAEAKVRLDLKMLVAC